MAQMQGVVVQRPGVSRPAGSGLTKVFIAFVVFSMFTITITVVGAAAQARLVYALARDNIL